MWGIENYVTGGSPFITGFEVVLAFWFAGFGIGTIYKIVMIAGHV